jgi:hypothetical protein
MFCLNYLIRAVNKKIHPNQWSFTISKNDFIHFRKSFAQAFHDIAVRMLNVGFKRLEAAVSQGDQSQRAKYLAPDTTPSYLFFYLP